MKAVITGATKGIGRALAETFASKGFDLAICSRNEEDLKQTRKELLDKYPSIEVLTQQTDMSKKEEVRNFGTMIQSVWDHFDVLINNAGVYIGGEIHKEEEGVLEQQIETNLYSAYYMTRSLLDLMLNKKKGHVFNICSIASFMAYPNGGSYSISKFAMLGFSKVLREEMKDKGIKVTSVMPGATWSNSWAGVELPESRLMPAEDIAKAVWGAWELSDSTVIEDIILRPQLGDL